MKTRIKSCLGCDAMEMGIGMSNYCTLGYKTEPCETVGGFYGKAKQAITCKIKPAEPCPKPRTVKEFLRLWREQERKRMDTYECMVCGHRISVMKGTKPIPTCPDAFCMGNCRPVKETSDGKELVP